jgi:hypothetical protein
MLKRSGCCSTPACVAGGADAPLEDVDLSDRLLLVRRGLSAGQETLPKGRRHRFVPSPRPQPRLRQGEFTGPEDYVLANRLGRRLDRSALRRRCQARLSTTDATSVQTSSRGGQATRRRVLTSRRRTVQSRSGGRRRCPVQMILRRMPQPFGCGAIPSRAEYVTQRGREAPPQCPRVTLLRT